MVLFSAIAALILVFFIPSIRDIWKITPTPIPPATDTPPPPPTQPPVVMLTLEAEAYGKGAPGQTVSSKARCSLNGRRYRPNVDELTSPSLHYELRHVDNGGRDWVCVLIEHPSSGIELILDGRDDTNDYDWCEVGVDLDVVKGYDSGDVKIWMGQGITAENCQTESWCP